MTKQEWYDLAVAVAVQSKCAKRKVGVVLTDATRYVTATNYNPDGTSCEWLSGDTKPTVVHAEVAALQKWALSYPAQSAVTAYVTHPPCTACAAALAAAGVQVEVVDAFLKFDTAKLRYDLIPPSTLEGLAKVLTYGAKKYKPNNWKQATELGRYEAAMMRHFEAYRAGEDLDEDSGLPHLAHALANIAFLLELTAQNTK